MADDKDTGKGTHKEQPIIIKKVKKGGHGGHHGGAWKVAYADFVTAMMAFFIVMWILASSEEVKQAVSGYFQDPGLFKYELTKNGSLINLNVMPSTKKGSGSGEGAKPMDISFTNKGNSDSLAGSISAGILQKAINDSIKATSNVEKLGNEMRSDFVKQIAQQPAMKEILSNIKIEMTQEGLRIELIESKDALFFDVGSARLSKDALSILKQLGERISTLPNIIEIEGHTDAQQYGKSSSYTNWELSNDRANAARRVLSNYLWNGQIDKVSGFADRRLRNPNNPFDMSNRRVSILIKQINSKTFLNESQEQLGAKK